MNFKKDFFYTIHKIWLFLQHYKRYSLGWVILFFVIVYSFSWSSTNETKTQKTYTVTTWSIKNTIKVLGDTKITNQQTLTFWYEWTVKALYVKEWDTVKKGQLLAEIDKWDLQKNIAQQSLSLQSAKVSYQKVLKQYSEADKLKAQQNIDDTLLKLSIAKKDLQDMTANKDDSFQTNDTWVQSLLISSKSMIIDVKSMSEAVDKIFGFTDKRKYINENISDCISEKDRSARTITENYFGISQWKINDVQAEIKKIESASVVTAEMLQALQNTNKDLLNNMSLMLANALNGVENTPLCAHLTQSQIDGWSSTVNNYNTKILSYISSTNTNLASIKSTAVDILNKKNEIKWYEAQLAMYKETAEEMAEGLSYEDRILQENNIKQGQISLSKLEEQTENYELRAPFDGNIDMITFKVWDNITNETISQEGITISNPNFYEIDMLIDQVDIVKIQKGQIATITFDAYEWYEVTGAISNIDPTPVENAGVVSYTAIIAMQKWEKKIFDSMTVNIEIMTENKENIIIVPTTAIQTKNNKSFVKLIKNGISKIKPVEIGATDTFNTEIITWLTIGEIVLLDEYITASKTTAANTKSTGSWFPAEKGMSSMRWLGVWWGAGGFRPE